MEQYDPSLKQEITFDHQKPKIRIYWHKKNSLVYKSIYTPKSLDKFSDVIDIENSVTSSKCNRQTDRQITHIHHFHCINHYCRV